MSGKLTKYKITKKLTLLKIKKKLKRKKKEYTKLMREYQENVCDKLTINEPDVMIIYKGGNIVCGTGYKSDKKIQIMSMTKTIVCWIFMILFQKSSELKKYQIPIGNDGKSTITIQQILNHTAGYYDKKPMEEMYKSDDWVKFAKENIGWDKKKQGTYNYSNFAYILLGEIYRIVTGESVNDAYSKVFKFNTDKNGNSDTAGGIMIKPIKLLDLSILILSFMSIEDEKNIIQHVGETAGKEMINKLKENRLLRDEMLQNNYGIRKIKDSEFYEFQDGYLGQYLVFNIKKKLIAIRLKSKKKGLKIEDHDDPKFVENVVTYFS